MRMHEIVILGLIVFVLVARVVRSPRPSARRTDAELARLVDRTTIELVEEHLARRPLRVVPAVGHDLRGAWVRLEGEALHLRLRLYDRSPPLPSGARLTSLRWTGGRGWVVRLATDEATWSLLGWHLEVQPRRRAGMAPAGTRWWE